MIALHPAPAVPLKDDWSLIASQTGRYAEGLRTTVGLRNNGTLATTESFPLDSAEHRQAFAQVVAYRIKGLPQAAIEHKLLELFTGVEGSLRAEQDQTEEDKESQATRLVKLALAAGVELFHTPDQEAHATLSIDGHQETWPLKVKGFRRWLARLFYEQNEKSPGGQAIQDAVGVLEGQACFDGPEHPVYTRLAAHNGAIYLDLANEAWQVVEITATGWRVIDTPPVKFRRPRGMLPLPTPVDGGILSRLRDFVNISRDSENDWRLLVSWLLAALRPTGPYPVLVVHGEQGSAKSTLVRVLRSLVDPNTAALRTTPRDERDLVIAAKNAWLIALDNLSHLPEWLSDGLCRLATESGFATRELYTDDEEALFSAQRPIVLNGIEELATRPDLLDRAILLYLPTIPDDKRQDEAQFWEQFETARSGLLGALLDVVASALGTLPSVTRDRLPRMADFARWACAAAPRCGWTAQDFLEAYTGAREATHELTLEASPVAPVLRELLASQKQWEGTASELLTALDGLAGEKSSKQKTWPKNGRALSNTLRRLSPTLRAIGIQVRFGERSGKQGSRILQLIDTKQDAGRQQVAI
jgi:hypothetical protein